jgi:hypothetical protein
MAEYYAGQINTLQAQVPSGITQAAQIGNQITATRAQQSAVEMNAQGAALQALATAELRKAHRETLLDARALRDEGDAVIFACSQMTEWTSPACGGATGGGIVTAAAAP